MANGEHLSRRDFTATGLRSEWYVEPSQVFDNLYYVGTEIQSMWAVKTSEGIVLHDTAFDYMVEDVVDKGFATVDRGPH